MPSELEQAAEPVRLYLSPLTPALLSTYLPGQNQSYATDVSYHTIETFPERSYGYLTLPAMEAAKVKSKFKGAILKGSKVRAEDARPVKRKAVDESDGEADASVKKRAKREKKQRKLASKAQSTDEVIPGVQLEAGRSVKRGWTEVKEVKSRKSRKEEQRTKDDRKGRQPEQSKYTKMPEVLFKAKVPMNKKTTDDPTKEKRKAKKKRDASNVTLVHEFEHTQKQASFLKNTASTAAPSAAYVDGKGWVDQNGSITEEARPLPARPKSKKKPKDTITAQTKPSTTTPDTSNAMPRSPSLSSDTGSDSSSISSDSDSSTSDSDAESSTQLQIPDQETAPSTTTGASRHPLEKLFKRDLQAQDKRPSPIETSFSFFGGADEAESQEENEHTNISIDDGPQTPFAQHVTARNVSRSGAPTPDTAAVHRRFSFTRGTFDADDDVEMSGAVTGEQQEDDEDKFGDMLSPVNEGIDEDERATAVDGEAQPRADGQEESEFASWFWKHRGDNNRLWRARRKEAMKEKRQRETRRLGRRIL